MKVLVLGSAGYAGPVVCDYLKEKGMEVVGYDNLMYGGRADIIADVCNVNKLLPAINHADAVVNLSGMSMDLAEDLKPEFTWRSNYEVNRIIADMIRVTGKRCVYASSGSVYGTQEGRCTEETILNPLTLYAQTKALSEPLFKDTNTVTFRFATIYGMSPNLRLDTITNHMIADSYFKNKVMVQGSERYRAVIHVKDVAQGIYLALTSSLTGIFNLGSDEQNYKIGDLGKLIADKTGARLEIDDSGNDKRSYIIDYKKVKQLGFEAKFTPLDAIDELYNAFRFEVSNMDDSRYYRVRYLKEHGSL